MNFPVPPARPSAASKLWSDIRRSPLWLQLGAAAVVVVLLAGVAGAVAGGNSSDKTPVQTQTSTTTSTTERHPTTTIPPVTTLPPPPSLEAGLAGLKVAAERRRDGYDRALFPSWDDVDGDGCDTRCEVLDAQRRPDGTWLSAWDGYVTDDPTELEVDHVVALAEAWDSGADAWSSAQRDEFADDVDNLQAVSASENQRKGDDDAAEWFPARAEANCLFASTVVRVKTRWSLTVDQAELDALANLLATCPGAPTTTTSTMTTSTTTTIAAPPPVTAPLPPPSPLPTSPDPAPEPAPEPSPEPSPEPEPVPDCTPGYDPCIPPGPDVDCAGGGGNGPRYVDGPVSVTGSDPYGLDGNDNDGIGCES